MNLAEVSGKRRKYEWKREAKVGTERGAGEGWDSSKSPPPLALPPTDPEGDTSKCEEPTVRPTDTVYMTGAACLLICPLS